MKRRALLLSGGINPSKDLPRYANDIAAFYELLRNKYNYSSDEIRVCAGPGGVLQLASGPIAVASARRDAVLAALAWLAELGDGDLALLMVTDHGGPEGISLWKNSQFLTPADLQRALAVSPATKVLILGQCNSARFGAMTIGRAVICCACGPDHESYPVPRPAKDVEPRYNEFIYQMAGALGGIYPDGAPLLQDGDHPLPPPGALSLTQAFGYAHDHDRWITGTRRVEEKPEIFDPECIADQVRL